MNGLVALLARLLRSAICAHSESNGSLRQVSSAGAGECQSGSGVEPEPEPEPGRTEGGPPPLLSELSQSSGRAGAGASVPAGRLCGETGRGVSGVSRVLRAVSVVRGL